MNVSNTALHKESLGNGRFITERDRKEFFFILSLPQYDSLDNSVYC